jgi:membrane protein required for colicin V production
MNGFDLALIAVLTLSVLFAFVRGIVRELIGLAAWVVGLVLAISFAGPLAESFTRLDITPVAKHVLAFTVILILALIAGAIISHLLSGVVHALGLGFVDRLLGAAYGIARGLAVVVLFALIAGVTSLPKQKWWQNATLGKPLADVALSLRPYLPRAWADRLDYSAAGTLSAGLRTRAVEVL